MSLTVKGRIVQEDEGLYYAECKDLGIEQFFTDFDAAVKFLRGSIPLMIQTEFSSYKGKPVKTLGTTVSKLTATLTMEVSVRSDRTLDEFVDEYAPEPVKAARKAKG